MKFYLIVVFLSLLIACGGGGGSESNTSSQNNTSTNTETNSPEIPSGLTCTLVRSTQVDLVWNSSSDTGDSGLAGYSIYRDGLQIDTTTATAYSDTGLAPDTEYTYTVSAYDNASNNSAQSTAVNVTTLTEPDIVGLMAYYSFDEGFGITSFDGTSNENDGIITAASRVEGKIGNGLLFGLDNSHVYIENLDGLIFDQGLITIEAWIKPDTVDAGEVYRIIGQTGHRDFSFQIRDGRLEIIYEGQSYHYGSTSILPDVWTHIAFTSDGTDIVTYTNGVENAKSNITLPIQWLTLIRVGAHYFYTGGSPIYDYVEEFPGIIDELRIWDGQRTSDEIFTYYESTM